MTRPARGERNNNWGNIDYAPSNKWVGQVGLELTPLNGQRARFAAFDKPENGIRALALLLQAYQDKHGLKTIRGMFDRYAPPNENPTASYIASVARAAGTTPDGIVDVKQYAVARPMVEAVVRVELGYLPVGADKVIDEGLRRAGVVKPVDTIAQAAATPTGRSTIGLAGLGTAAAAATPLLQSLAGLPQWTGVAVVVAVLICGAVYLLHLRRSNQSLQP